MIWTTKDGRRLPISEMSDDHLRNAVAMLRRQAARYEAEADAAIGFASGDSTGAYYAETAFSDAWDRHMRACDKADALGAELTQRNMQ